MMGCLEEDFFELDRLVEDFCGAASVSCLMERFVVDEKERLDNQLSGLLESGSGCYALRETLLLVRERAFLSTEEVERFKKIYDELKTKSLS